MSLLAHATGASGLATITLTGVTNQAIRIYGFAASTTDTNNLARVPKVTITNVRDDSGNTFTAQLVQPEAGAVATLARAINYLYGKDYEFVVSQGASSVVAFDSGVNTSAPELCVWYTRV